MLYTVSGTGKIFKPFLLELGLIPPKESLEQVTTTIDAVNFETAVYESYFKCGDGYWIDGDTYCYFAEPPTITEVPPDQALAAAGAEPLPGLGQFFQTTPPPVESRGQADAG